MIWKATGFWLMKSEPTTYSIDDLKRETQNMWEGCRNYTVRNFMRDLMQPGDKAFFYHSVCEPAGIVGTMEIKSRGYPDPTQFDSSSEYYDPKSKPENPSWMAVDVKFNEKFERMITLAELKRERGLENMLVTKKGQMLSVMPVTPEEWEIVMILARS